jgi:hypothetical protein
MTQARALVGSIDTVALSRSLLDDAAATLPPAGFARSTLSTSQRPSGPAPHCGRS